MRSRAFVVGGRPDSIVEYLEVAFVDGWAGRRGRSLEQALSRTAPDEVGQLVDRCHVSSRSGFPPRMPARTTHRVGTRAGAARSRVVRAPARAATAPRCAQPQP